ncbi:MAG: 4-hydroxy-tetrahydrodipicolinate synthase [Bacteroidia bacterium]|nr:4-hydroxy-tetrahydrodipicolinate synthase [Bacteroidia bacterium]
MTDLEGLGVALATPFTATGEPDLAALTRLVAYCIDGGVDYLVVLGTTGESATLDKAEKAQVINAVIDANKGRLPLVLGIGGNNTKAVAQEIQDTDLQDFDAILTVSPYYNKPTQDGIFKHYQALAKVATKPIVIYNVPSRTGSNVLPETILKLAFSCPNICGVKEASGDLDQIKDILDGKPSGFAVISGDDATALDTVLLGGQGVISVLGQGLPELFGEMIRSGSGGEVQKARVLETSLKEGMDLIFKEGNPSGIKALLHRLEICSPEVRLPLVKATVGLQSQINQYVDQLIPSKS